MLNIIKATFYDKPCAWTDEQWQWDYGQILVFEGLELPDAYEVHFSNIAIGGESITQIGGENGVTIPDQFFTTGETIYAWVYLHQGEVDGETVYSVTIPVKKRPQPSDTPPTPQEQSAIDQAIAALNAAVEQTAEDVETTTENAEQAAASAENAAASAEEASGYLEGVTAKANEAAASASAAAQSATTATEKAAEVASGIARAEQAAENAEAAETGAQTAQAAAEAAVGRAESYAGEASRSAQAASTSATQAAGSATSASGFAGDANTSAQAAASSATTASTKATEAAQSASTASTSATNAINAKTAAETAQGKAEDAQEAAETAQEAAETAVESIQGKSEQIDQNTEDIGDLKAEINKLQNGKADIIISNASGTIATFTDGAEYDAVGLVAEFAPYQEGTGDPSPTNIRLIHGWIGLDIHADGKNLLNPASMVRGGYDTDGNIAPNISSYISYNLYLPSGTYTFSTDLSDNYFTRYLIDNVKNELTLTAQSVTFTLSKYSNLKISMRKTDSSDISGETPNAMIEVGSVSTPYEPYNGTTTPVTWQTEAGEVYGGYVDAVRGKLVATYGRKVVNTESTIIRTWSDGYYPYYMRTTLSGLKYGSGVNILGDSIPYKTKTELDSGVTCFYRPSTSQTNIYWIAPGCSTEEGATALRSSGYVFVYELETPIEYDITPATIETLKGYNNVWSSAGGNVDVTYRADTKLYIDGKQIDIRNTIAPIEDGETASQAYAIGKFFYRNGSFCKAKTAIASGAAFTLGTNYEVTTVAAELFTALS